MGTGIIRIGHICTQARLRLRTRDSSLPVMISRASVVKCRLEHERLTLQYHSLSHWKFRSLCACEKPDLEVMTDGNVLSSCQFECILITIVLMN
jgi:hypothetical protein